MKKFKTKNYKKQLLIYILVFIISTIVTISYLKKANLIKNNTIISYFIKSNFTDFNYDSLSPYTMIKYALNINLLKDNIPSEEVNVSESPSIDLEIPIKDEVKPLEKIVYIYNTHQEEKYQNTFLEAYNITPTVLIASKMLKEYLEALGIGVVVEEENVANKLRSLNLNYSGSYKVTRTFLENATKKTPTLKYFIDLHRDSSVYEKTTTTIEYEKYAKVLFLVGLDNPNYSKNLELAEKLKQKVIDYDSSLSRGILKKSGKGVNGVYNQDFNENVMLIEVGGQYNNISEVDNTLKFLANILAAYIKEEENA